MEIDTMKSLRAWRFVMGAAVAAIAFCGTAVQAYDAEFDYNADGVVDEADLDLLASAFNTAEGDPDFDPIFDHDGDGFVGGSDVVLAQSAANAD